MNVAITGVGGGMGQSVIRALRLSSLPLHLIGLDANGWAAGLYMCDEHALVPRVSDEEAYLAALEALIRKHEISALIPALDVELPVIARARDRLLALGCCPISSGARIIEIARDKLLSYTALSAVGVPFVRTWAADEFKRTCTEEMFPVLVKPKGGAGSVGTRVLFGKDDLAQDRFGPNDIVQDYLVPRAWGLRKVTPRDVTRAGRLRQQDEVSLQAVVSPKGEIAGIYASINELMNGVPTRVCPTLDPAILASARQAFEAFIGLGHVGPMNLQGRMTDRGLIYYELNPRFTAITAVREAMGFKECEATLRLFVQGESVEAVAPLLTYDEDTVCLRHMTDQLVPRTAIAPRDRVA